MKLQSIAIQYSIHFGRSLKINTNNEIYTTIPHKNCNCLEFQRINNLIKESKTMIKENPETGDLEIVSGGNSIESSPPILSGPGQTMTKESYIAEFAKFINSDNPRELMRMTLSDIPDRLFLELTAFEQLDFIHKLDSCVRIFKVYQQSAEFNHRNKVETLELDEQVELRKKDQKFKVKPSEEENQKKRKETQQEKLVKQLRDLNYSEEDILRMVHGKK